MLDIANEKPLTLSQAARMLPELGGRPLHPSTIWRWCRKGVGGVKLEYCKIGRRIVTTKEAVVRFSNNVAEADSTFIHEYIRRPSKTSEIRRELAILQAEQRLKKNGV